MRLDNQGDDGADRCAARDSENIRIRQGIAQQSTENWRPQRRKRVRRQKLLEAECAEDEYQK